MLVGIEVGAEEGEEEVVDFQVEVEEQMCQTVGEEEVAADVWRGVDADKSLSQEEE